MQAFRGGLVTSIMQSNELKAAYSRLSGRFFWTGLRRVRPPSESSPSGFLLKHPVHLSRQADKVFGC